MVQAFYNFIENQHLIVRKTIVRSRRLDYCECIMRYFSYCASLIVQSDNNGGGICTLLKRIFYEYFASHYVLMIGNQINNMHRKLCVRTLLHCGGATSKYRYWLLIGLTFSSHRWSLHDTKGRRSVYIHNTMITVILSHCSAQFDIGNQSITMYQSQTIPEMELVG